MNNIAHKYNRFLLTLIAFAPIIGYFLYTFLHIDFFKTMQFLSYIGIFLIILFRSKSDPIIFPKYLFFYLLFILYVFYSNFIQLERNFESKYLLTRLIGGLSFLFIIENIYISKKHYRFIIHASSIIIALAVIVIVIQEVLDPTFLVKSDFRRIDLIRSDNNRLLSIYSWIGALSDVGLSFVPIFILITEHLAKKRKKLLIWILMGLVFAFLSKARWIMVYTSFVFVVLIVNHRNMAIQFLKYLLLLPVILAISLFALNTLDIDTNKIVNERILESNKKSINKTSAGTRLLAFKAFDHLYWRNPIFGVGNLKYGMGGTGKQGYELRSFLKGRSAQIHVGYLSLFYMYGLIGGFLFLSFLFLLLRRLYNRAKVTGIWSPFLGFLGFAVVNLTEVVFIIYFMGLVIIMIADKYYYQDIAIRNKLDV